MTRTTRILLALTVLLGWHGCATSSGSETETNCSVGSEGCTCTNGGACDTGLECLSNLCVNPDPNVGGAGGSGANIGGGFSNTGGGGGNDCAQDGCKKLDVLFAIDHSASMTDEINALVATQAFTAVIDQLAAVNCGDIDFRIGVTDDNNPTFIVPGGFSGSNPWFDSNEQPVATIATEFATIPSALFGGSPTPTGCEHVLTNATALLESDTTGFVRDDALLVLILVSDVDDYGEYDQGIVDCGILGQQPGCMTPPPPLNTLHADLLGLKNGDDKGLAAIVVAGDPTINAGVNFCSQPASCCGPLDCDGAFHADRLWAFAGLMNGSNGFVANVCNGPTSVPMAIQQAFANNIDLACKGFEPPS